MLSPSYGAVMVHPFHMIGTTYTLSTLGALMTDLDGDILTIVVLADDDHLTGMNIAAPLAIMSLLQVDAPIRQNFVRNRPLFGVLLILRHDFPLLVVWVPGMGEMVPPHSQRLLPTD